MIEASEVDVVFYPFDSTRQSSDKLFRREPREIVMHSVERFGQRAQAQARILLFVKMRIAGLCQRGVEAGECLAVRTDLVSADADECGEGIGRSGLLAQGAS